MKARNDLIYREKFRKLAEEYNEKNPLDKIDLDGLYALHKVLTDPRMFKRVCCCKKQPLNLKYKK